MTVRDMDDDQFIMNVLKSLNFHGAGVWIGLNDRQKENTFTWISGKYYRYIQRAYFSEEAFIFFFLSLHQNLIS